MNTGRCARSACPLNPLLMMILSMILSILTFPCLDFPAWKLFVSSFWGFWRLLSYNVQNAVKVGCQVNANYFIFSVF